MSDTVHGFKDGTVPERLIRLLNSFESGRGEFKPMKSRVSQEARYAKILVPVDTVDDNDKKEATGVEVKWDDSTFDFVEVTENPVQYDIANLDSAGTTVFDTTNISSTSTMAADDIVLLQHYPNLSETSDWLVVETGGGGSRAFVVITAVTDASNYVGDVITSPVDPTVLKEDVAISVPGATANSFEVGYTAFMDVVDDVYYPDGFLLG